MKISFLETGGIALILTIILTYLMVISITISFRKKYHPKTSPNLAHGITLGGKLLAGLILITGIFSPIRDYLLVSSAGSGASSGASWSFLFICCCLLAIFFVLASALEVWFSSQVFKGQSLAVELQENNLSVAIIRALLVAALAFALLFAMGVFMQAFIPLPTIPNIR
jgi:hypothetical protein